jgi:hypothetical protein
MTNREEIFQLIEGHPEGLDDDDISRMTGIQPRQQVQQLCNQLADSQRIRRQSVGKVGKRRKIHNFPGTNPPQADSANQESATEWHKRLAALVAATGRSESELLEESLHLLAIKVLQRDKERTPEFP